MADSACSLGTSIAAEHGVRLVPMQIEFGGRIVPETELGPEEIVESLGTGLSTSAPSPGAFAAAIEEADGGAGVVVLTVSSKLSASYAAASLAAGLTGVETRVVDTSTAAGAEGLVVLAACRAAREGRSVEATAQRAALAARGVRLVAAVGSLEHLARSGRVPQAANWAGAQLGLQAMFELSAGRIRLARPVRGTARADEAMVGRVVRSDPLDGSRLHVAGMHSFDERDAAGLVEALERSCSPAYTLVGSFGPVMLVHTGPGMRGLAWLWDPDDSGSCPGTGDGPQSST